MASRNKRFYRNFRLNITVRIILLSILAFSLAFVTANQEMLFVPFAISLAFIYGVINLVLYIEKTNRDLTHFLLSLREGAFTESYTSANRGKHYEELSDALNEVVKDFAKLNTQKELHYQYLQVLNEKINVAILSFDKAGALLMMNPAAKHLLKLPTFSKLDHFKLIDHELFEAASKQKPEERSIVKIVAGDELAQLSVQIKEIILQDKEVRIVLLQNLTNELESKEIEAWHQLMRVLTHEIMNSVTPITSLSSAAESILSESTGIRKSKEQVTDDNIEDVFNSVSTIRSRGKGLLNFVKAYREYAKPSEATFERTDISAVVRRILALLRHDLEKNNIELIERIPANRLEANADTSLIEQVLINLLKNAIEAVDHSGNGKITVDVKRLSGDKVQISVMDNGPGIDEDTLSKIFVPFFTTKQTGTGIGLSLCKQIMKLHQGTIKASSIPDKGTIMTIHWG